MLEIGKYYSTEAKNLRAIGLTVNKKGETVSRPLYSYWNDSCNITLLCEFIHGDVAILKEFNTNRLVYGVKKVEETSQKIDKNMDSDTIKNKLNEKLLWVSKGELHEIAKDTVRNNKEAVQLINILAAKSEEGIADDLADLFNNPLDSVEPAKCKVLKKGS